MHVHALPIGSKSTLQRTEKSPIKKSRREETELPSTMDKKRKHSSMGEGEFQEDANGKDDKSSKKKKKKQDK